MPVQLEPWDGELAPGGAAQDCDGGGDESLEAVTRTAQSRGWGTGWPDCQSSNLVTVRVSDRVRLAVRRELAPLVGWLCEETLRRGYPFREGQCWGFACRAIRGSSSPSNHSWGLAVDINSLANPMTSSLKTDMPSWMPELWTAHGFRWGGTYTTRKDAMHYEYMGSPGDAASTIGRLTPSSATSAVLGAGAPPFPLPAGHVFGTTDSGPESHSGHEPADRPLVAQLQARLLERGWDLGSSGADGFFGPVVHAAVLAFQREKGLAADGLVGPVTWSALWLAPVT